MKAWLAAILLLIATALEGQGIVDSLFRISQVEVVRQRNSGSGLSGSGQLHIDSLVMRDRIYGSLSELLSWNSTLFIKEYAPGAMATVSFRGSAPAHTQVTWNGLNINSPMLGMADLSLLPVFIADDIGIAYGGASVSEEAGGLGGLIAISSEADWSNRFSGKYYQSAGSYSTFTEMIRVDAGNRQFQSSTRIYRNASENDYPFINKNRIEQDPVTGAFYHPEQRNDNGAYRKTGISQSFWSRPAANLLFSIHTWYQASDRSIPTVMSTELYDPAFSRKNIQEDHTLKAVFSGRYQEHGLDLGIRSGVDYQSLDYVSQNLISGLEPHLGVNSGSSMLTTSQQVSAGTDAVKKLSVNIRARYDHHAITTMDSVTGNGYAEQRQEASFYGGISYDIHPRAQLMLQARKILISGLTAPLIWTGGGSVELLRERNLVLRGNITRNYHAPSLNDLYWQPGGNPGLEPEKGVTGEIGIDYRTPEASKLKAKAGVTAYHSKISNWILWVPALKVPWKAVNVKEVTSSGIEMHLDLQATWNSFRFELLGNAGLTRAINTGTAMIESGEDLGKQLPYMPVLSGNLLFSADYRGYFIKYRNQSVGARSLVSSGQAGLEDDSRDILGSTQENNLLTLYPHYLNGISAGREFDLERVGITVELKVENLFNETYRNVFQRMMPGRHYLLMLKIDF